MPPPAYPDDSWGKDEYWQDVKWYRRSMVTVNQMNLTRKQRDCCRRITKTIIESINILKHSGKQLSKAEKQWLYEQTKSRERDFASFFIEE